MKWLDKRYHTILLFPIKGKSNVAWNEKLGIFEYIHIKQGYFWIVLSTYFIKHKLLISEENLDYKNNKNHAAEQNSWIFLSRFRQINVQPLLQDPCMHIQYNIWGRICCPLHNNLHHPIDIHNCCCHHHTIYLPSIEGICLHKLLKKK